MTNRQPNLRRLQGDRAHEPEVLLVARQAAGIVRRVTGNPAYRVFLFGSWATGEARQRSDIDIGIDGPDRVDPGAMFEIREACAAIPTLYTIELVDFSLVGPRFRKEAMAHLLELEPV